MPIKNKNRASISRWPSNTARYVPVSQSVLEMRKQDSSAPISQSFWEIPKRKPWAPFSQTYLHLNYKSRIKGKKI
jgi:hypothetical protein